MINHLGFLCLTRVLPKGMFPYIVTMLDLRSCSYIKIDAA
jgi:hypothetical protein